MYTDTYNKTLNGWTDEINFKVLLKINIILLMYVHLKYGNEINKIFCGFL